MASIASVLPFHNNGRDVKTHGVVQGYQLHITDAATGSDYRGLNDRMVCEC
jgi:hypothetical protein